MKPARRRLRGALSAWCGLGFPSAPPRPDSAITAEEVAWGAAGLGVRPHAGPGAQEREGNVC